MEDHQKKPFKILFVSSNIGKQREVKQIIGEKHVICFGDKIDIPEIQSAIHEKVVKQKLVDVIKYLESLGNSKFSAMIEDHGITHVMIEDTGLGFQFEQFILGHYIKSRLEILGGVEGLYNTYFNSCEHIARGLKATCIFAIVPVVANANIYDVKFDQIELFI